MLYFWFLHCCTSDKLFSEAARSAAAFILSKANEIMKTDAPEGEHAYLTEAMTRPMLDEKLAGMNVVSVIRVLDWF